MEPFDKQRAKQLAQAGNFAEIERLFGDKARIKAESYVRKNALKEAAAEAEKTAVEIQMPVTAVKGQESKGAMSFGADPLDPRNVADEMEKVSGLKSFSDDTSDDAACSTVDALAVAGASTTSSAPSLLGAGSKKLLKKKLVLQSAAAPEASAPAAASAEQEEAAPAPAAAGLIKKQKKRKVLALEGDAASSEAEEGPPADVSAPPKKKKKKTALVPSAGAAPAAAVADGAKFKKPLSAYMRFARDHRAEVKAQHPDLAPTDVAVELGRMWRDTTDAERAAYETEAKEEKLAAAALEGNDDVGLGAGESSAKGKKKGSGSQPKAKKDASSSSASQAAGSKKATSKSHRRRTGDDDSDDDESDHGEPDADEVFTVEDPRGDALRAAAESGAKASVKNGYIVGSSVEDSARLPRLSGRMNYKAFSDFKVGDEVSLVIPAWYDFQDANASQLLALRNSGVEADCDLKDMHAWSKNGVLLGCVVEVSKLTEKQQQACVGPGGGGSASSASAPTGLRSLHGAASSSAEAYADFEDIDVEADMELEDAEAGEAAAAASSSEAPAADLAPWRLITLEVTKGVAATSSSSVAKSSAAAAGGEEDENPADDEPASSSSSSKKGGSGGGPSVSSGRTIRVLWLPPQDERVASPILLHRAAYVASLKRQLAPGTQIRAMFPTDPEDPSQGEWFEGRVYSVEPRAEDKKNGWKASAYLGIRVIWYEQDVLTQEWYVDVMQTNNEVSPWEVSTDRLPFVRAENVRAFCGETPVLSSPRDVLTHLLSLEAAVPFKAPVSKKECPAYYERIKNPIDLGAIHKHLQAGKYDRVDASSSSSSSAAASGGIQAFWEDLRLLLRNAKTFNQPERYEWRLADALQAEIRRVKSAYLDLGSAAAADASA